MIAAALLWLSQVSVDGGFMTDILGPSLLAATGLGFGFVTTTPLVPGVFAGSASLGMSAVVRLTIVVHASAILAVRSRSIRTRTPSCCAFSPRSTCAGDPA